MCVAVAKGFVILRSIKPDQFDIYVYDKWLHASATLKNMKAEGNLLL